MGIFFRRKIKKPLKRYKMEEPPMEISGAIIFALIMSSLVLMCVISLCWAKAQQKKRPAQLFAPGGDIPGKNSRNFVMNREIQRTTKEINFGPKIPITDFVEMKPNYETVTEAKKPRNSQSRSRYEDKSTLDRQKQKNTRANRNDGQGQRSNREKAQRGQGSIQKNVRRNEKTHKVPI